MASISAPATGRPPPDLPNEIFLLLAQNCPRATLKNLRLVSKTLAQMVEPYLWRHVVLVPNEYCILEFVNVLKHSNVTRHVTKLTYDARFGSFHHHIKSYAPDSTIPCSEEDKAQGNAVLERATQGRFQPYEDMAIEVAILTKALQMLPNLCEVRIRDYEDGLSSRSSKVPYFYHKICRAIRVNPKTVNFAVMAGTSGRSYTKGFLTAAFSAGSQLQTFKSKNMDGRALFGVVPMKSPAAYQQLNMFQAVMASLRFLDLSFRNDTLLTSANHIEVVQALLKSAKQLRALRLKLTDCSLTRSQYSDDDLMSDLSGLLESRTGGWLCRPLLPRLEMLVIDACICHDEDLIHFLKIHSTTLRRLELSNITLLGGEDRRECWVKLIRHFKTDLKLASISFSGWFSNGGRQQWFVAKESVGSERLKARVEKYVVDRAIRACPLDPIAIKPNQGDVEKPANGEEYEGDLTWTMVYPNKFGGHMDWQLTEPSFGIHSDGVSGQSSGASDAYSMTSLDAASHHDDDEATTISQTEALLDLVDAVNAQTTASKSASTSTGVAFTSSATKKQTWNPFSTSLTAPIEW